MVFKTICMGSIPVVLVLFTFNTSARVSNLSSNGNKNKSALKKKSNFFNCNLHRVKSFVSYKNLSSIFFKKVVIKVGKFQFFCGLFFSFLIYIFNYFFSSSPYITHYNYFSINTKINNIENTLSTIAPYIFYYNSPNFLNKSYNFFSSFNKTNTDFINSLRYVFQPRYSNMCSSKSSYHIELYSLLLLNYFFLMKSSSNKLTSLNPVNSLYFTNISSFFPNIQNVLRFNKTVFYSYSQDFLKELSSSLIKRVGILGTSSLIIPTVLLSTKIFKKQTIKYRHSFLVSDQAFRHNHFFFKKFMFCSKLVIIKYIKNLNFKRRFFKKLLKNWVFKIFFRYWYFRRKFIRRLIFFYKRFFKKKKLTFAAIKRKSYRSLIRLKKFTVINITYKVGVIYRPNSKKNLWLETYSYSWTLPIFKKSMFSKFNFYTLTFSKKFLFLFFCFTNSFFLKNFLLTDLLYTKDKAFSFLFSFSSGIRQFNSNIVNSNIIPNKFFSFKLSKSLVSNRINFFLKDNLIPWVYVNIIRFVEFCSARKAFLQIYSFMNQAIDISFIILYRRWIPRLSYYERRLGHRFFLEEALHIIHIGFTLKDIKLINTWLRAIIKRISFWKTRFIFRFLKYIFNNYFIFILKFLGVRGFKVKLKGKISVAGNSRKRSILFRLGKTSHSITKLRVLHHISLVNTFTGVMGLQTWLFY